MKKLFFLLLLVPMIAMLYPMTADAMKLSEPIYLGSIAYEEVADGDDPRGFVIRDADANKGKRVLKFGTKMYKKGCATFGKDGLAVHIRYDLKDHVQYFGDKEGTNAVEINIADSSVIQAIETDFGIVFYYINSMHREGSDFLILGKLSDGRFIQYVDSDKYTNMLWKETGGMVSYNRMRVVGNAIVIDYSAWNAGNNSTKYGELRFPWDAKAQWFGVEKR